ncbi:MAG TPA: hypothetical protein VLJ11_15630 [Bryobacteraceae bacterium]|nr:hypothetical protein [Bryobacteraceae bacterium]
MQQVTIKPGAALTSITPPEARIAPQDDTARQFQVDRVFGKPLGALPFAVWVYARPLYVPRLSCGCRQVFDLLPESALQRTGGKRRSGLTVCPCMGRFIE